MPYVRLTRRIYRRRRPRANHHPVVILGSGDDAVLVAAVPDGGWSAQGNKGSWQNGGLYGRRCCARDFILIEEFFQRMAKLGVVPEAQIADVVRSAAARMETSDHFGAAAAIEH